MRATSLLALAAALSLAACDRTPDADDTIDTDDTTGDTTDDTDDTDDSDDDTDDTTGGGDTDTDTDVTLPGELATISEMRSGANGIAECDLLRVEGLVGTGLGDLGFYAQDPDASNIPAGLAVGSIVTVVGEYEEFRNSNWGGGTNTVAELKVFPGGMNPIVGSQVVITGTGGTITPIDVSIATLASEASAEPYESMLVRLWEGGSAMTVTTDPSASGQFGEWDVSIDGGTTQARIDQSLFSVRTVYTTLGPDDTITSATGPLVYDYGFFKVGVREIGDVTGYTDFVDAPMPASRDLDTGYAP